MCEEVLGVSSSALSWFDHEWRLWRNDHPDAAVRTQIQRREGAIVWNQHARLAIRTSARRGFPPMRILFQRKHARVSIGEVRTHVKHNNG